MPHRSLVLPGVASDLGDDVQELFEELSRRPGALPRPFSGDCRPAIDVRETDRTIEVVMDAAGVTPDAIRILFRSDVLLIVGDKTPGPMSEPPVFHLVEREFGRFARAVRLKGAFEVREAGATLRDGELIITLPKREERRGQAHRIAIT
jgi:HSP20 family protein